MDWRIIASIQIRTRTLRSAFGVSFERLFALSAWRETPFFTGRERAALAWTEAITNIQQGHASDEVYAEARAVFDEAELVKLTFAIAQINMWNRIAIASRVEVGRYQPAAHAAS